MTPETTPGHPTQVLGLRPDASEPEVRSAFRRLAKAPLIFLDGKWMEKCGKMLEPCGKTDGKMWEIVGKMTWRNMIHDWNF
jgi:hypothetical protein